MHDFLIRGEYERALRVGSNIVGIELRRAFELTQTISAQIAQRELQVGCFT